MKRPLLSLALCASFATAHAVDYPAPIGEAATRAFPHSMIGQLLFANGAYDYSGSGTVIRPNSVLTAAHNLWDADNGFSTDILFRRALSGRTDLSRQYASRIYVMSGYRENARRYSTTDVRTFSYDMGALVFARPVAGGSYAGWWANPELLAPGAIGLGYGGEFHSGEDLLAVTAVEPYQRISGAFFENFGLYFESGMSGGPVLARDASGKWFVAAVVVASASEPTAGGVRALDSVAGAFIRRYMK